MESMDIGFGRYIEENGHTTTEILGTHIHNLVVVCTSPLNSIETISELSRGS